jgi:hypothetical protein
MPPTLVFELEATTLAQAREQVIASVTQAWHGSGRPSRITLILPGSKVKAIGSHPDIVNLRKWALRQGFPQGFALQLDPRATRASLTLEW